MDELARLREWVNRLDRRIKRQVPSYRWGVVSAIHAGTPQKVDVYIGGSTVLTLNIPTFAHVTGLTAGTSVVSIRTVGSDLVVDGRVS